MIDYLIAEWEAVNADEWVKYESGGCGIEQRKGWVCGDTHPIFMANDSAVAADISPTYLPSQNFYHIITITK